MAILYLAGGLFNAAQRVHNLLLEKELTVLGHVVILPQRQALSFFSNGKFDVASIVRDCWATCINPEGIVVACIDGADADSGTAFELGAAMQATGRAVVFRTDFRTAQEQEVGVNAMLHPQGALFVYYPCFVTEHSEIAGFYRELAQKIHDAVIALVS